MTVLDSNKVMPNCGTSSLFSNAMVFQLLHHNYIYCTNQASDFLSIQPRPLKLRDHVIVGIQRYSPMSYWRHRSIDSK